MSAATIYAEEGAEGFLRDRTRKPGTPPVPEATAGMLVETTLSSPLERKRTG